MNTHLALLIQLDNQIEMIAAGSETFCRDRARAWRETHPIPEYSEIVIVQRVEVVG